MEKPAPAVIVYMATHKKILPFRDTIKKKTTSENKIYKKNPKFPWLSEAVELIGGIISL
jgi:hypothetical protein